jgi:hypothetical protein
MVVVGVGVRYEGFSSYGSCKGWVCGMSGGGGTRL